MKRKTILIVTFSLTLILSAFTVRPALGQEKSAGGDDRDKTIGALKNKVQALEEVKAKNKEEIDRLVQKNKKLLNKGPGSIVQDSGKIEEPQELNYAPAKTAQVVEPKQEASLDDPTIYKKANEAFIRGAGYSKKGDFENAGKEFEAALKLNPNLMAARTELARCYKELKDYKGALAQYRIITSKMPYAVAGYKSMADIYMEQKDANGAVTALNEAIALNPTADGLHERIGIIYYDEGLFEKAKEEFKKELTIIGWARESKKHLRLIEKKEREEKRKAKKK